MHFALFSFTGYEIDFTSLPNRKRHARNLVPNIVCQIDLEIDESAPTSYAIFQSYALLTSSHLYREKWCISSKKRLPKFRFFLSKMMQFARRLSECYNLNALLFLQILILHDRFFTVFGVIVSSHELAAARVSEEYVESQPSHFDSEVHELNNVDINQFSNGFSKLTGSQEVVSIASIAPVTFTRNKSSAKRRTKITWCKSFPD